MEKGFLQACGRKAVWVLAYAGILEKAVPPKNPIPGVPLYRKEKEIAFVTGER